MKKVITIVGARPQFVKAAVVSRHLAENDSFQEIILHTGQHFDANMSDVFFEEMEIPRPDYNLGIHSLSHGAMTAEMLKGIEKILLHEKPDAVLVYGDTNSTMAGALAAKKLLIPVAHVEAGLRSFNMKMPEEVNRIVTDSISDILFAPTEIAIKNLKNEGVNDDIIIASGDVMYDAALFYASKAEDKSQIKYVINLDTPFVLCTIHRQENTDNATLLRNIILALNELHHSGTRVVCPLHPRTRKKAEEYKLDIQFETIDPVGYFDIIMLLKNCNAVVTDSGGLQKEAYFFEKKCVTLREQTEWIELVKNGYNTLISPEEKRLYKLLVDAIDDSVSFEEKLYGNGNAGGEIKKALLKFLNK